MGNQEPPFEQPGEQPPPEQQPGEERGINYDPREGPRSDFAAPQTPPAYPQPQGYARPQQGFLLHLNRGTLLRKGTHYLNKDTMPGQSNADAEAHGLAV